MENQITRERGQLHPLNYLTFSSFSILPLRLKFTNLSALVIAKEKKYLLLLRGFFFKSSDLVLKKPVLNYTWYQTLKRLNL